ncbi:hypothetical protein M434DRAFT_29739 [Hypoxylon sp. CO27-5]|nr:hypothetical protein M434DRAFT_29739 [Hypoxylon sp. CO27-5]
MGDHSLFVDDDNDYSYLLDELDSLISKPPRELFDKSSNEPFVALGNKRRYKHFY